MNTRSTAGLFVMLICLPWLLSAGELSPDQNNTDLDRLVAELQVKDFGLHDDTKKALAGHGDAALPKLVELLQHEDEECRFKVCAVLGYMGSKASSVVTSIIKRFDDRSIMVRRNAAFAAGRTGNASLPHLQKALKAKSPLVRLGAVSALAVMKADAVTAVPDLIACLKDECPQVRAEAAYALSKMGPLASEGVHALTDALGDTNPRVRVNAAGALGSIGCQHAIDAIPLLIKGLKDEVESVRWSHVRALGKMRSAAKDAVPSLIELLNDKEEVRQEVISALGRIGPASAPAIPAIKRVMEEQTARHIKSSVCSLGFMGETAVPSITPYLKHDDPGVRWQAARSLELMGPVVTKAVPALVDALKDPNIGVARCAVRALGNSRTSSSQAVEALFSLLKHRKLSPMATRALAQLGKPAMSRMVKLLHSSDSHENFVASVFFSTTEVDISKAAPDLLQHVNREYSTDKLVSFSCINAVHALGKIGKPAADAVPILLKMLRDEELCFNAARSLDSIGATDHLPTIRRAGQSESLAVAISAAYLILEADPKDENALRKLTQWPQLEEFDRSGAIMLIERIRPLPRALLDTLVQGIREQGVTVRRSIVGQLGDMGAAAIPAIPALEAEVESAGVAHRQALEALKKIEAAGE